MHENGRLPDTEPANGKPADPLAAARQAVQADKQRRVTLFQARLQALCEELGCALQARVTIRGAQVSSQVEIVALDPAPEG